MPGIIGPGAFVYRTPDGKYTYQGLELLWTQNGGPKAMAGTMAAIALAESGGNPKARHVNADGSVDQGLWQINTSNRKLYKGQNVYDPNVNVKSAITLATHGRGLTNWTTYNNGAYKSHLPGPGPLSGVVSAIEHPGRDIQQVTGVITKPIVSPIESGLTYVGKEIVFALIIAGGGALILLGVLLIGADLGLAAFASVRNGRTYNRVGGLADLSRQRRARKTAESRSAELHGQRVRVGEAKIKTEQARATDLRSRSRARTTLARQTKAQRAEAERKAYFEGARDAQSPNLAAARAKRGKAA